MLEINLLAILVSGIVSMIIGALWYSPILFGNIWMKLSRLSQEALEEAKAKGMGKAYLANFIGVLLVNLVLAKGIVYMDMTSLIGGIMTALWVWVGFVLPVLLGSVLWEQRPIKLYILNVGYYLVSLVIAGVILGSWL